MTDREIHVLVIEDNEADFILTQHEILKDEETCNCKYVLHHSQTLNQGINFLKALIPDMVLLDLGLPDSEGVDGVSKIREMSIEVPIVVLSGHDNDDRAMSALKAGAQDYIIKGKKESTLRSTINFAIQRQEFLKQIKKAELAAKTASNVKSTFLANMSHEIRTPLTAILGFTGMVLSSEISDDNRKALDTVYRNAKHLLQIINNILDISKIEANAIEIKPESSDIFRLLEMLEHTFRLSAKEKGLSFNVSYKFPVPDLLIFDPLYLNQILINIVGNSIKFTKNGGININIEYNDEVLTFEISDTGVGMSNDDLDKIFQPFSQCDSSSTRAYGGTGLGLVIARKLARAMGGDIEVKSESGFGSTFTVTIHAERSSSAIEVMKKPLCCCDHLNTPIDNKIPRIPGKILIVEDMPDNQELMNYYIKKCGGSAVVADNGLAAINKINNEDFDLILMDMQMPVMDGYECVRYLKNAKCKTPIIAVTASAMDGAPEKCLDAGCDDYISKPFTAETFYKTIFKYCEKSSVKVRESTISDANPEVANIILGFIKRLPTRVSSLENSFKNKSWSALRSEAHNLAGADMFGFPELSHIAAGISDAAKTEKFDKIGDYINELYTLNEEIQAGKGSLEKMLH